MPIIKPTDTTAPAFYPTKNYSIVKYIDLTKFISLMYRKALFFCRIDKLEDQFEGTTSKANEDFRLRVYEQMLNDPSQPDLTSKQIRQKVKEQYEFDNKQRALHCVNCWNKKENESAELWKIYSDFSKGIMIRSSINQLIASLEKAKENISLSEIRYIDYNKDIMPDFNSMYPFPTPWGVSHAPIKLTKKPKQKRLGFLFVHRTSPSSNSLTECLGKIQIFMY